MCHMSGVTCKVSRVRCQVSRVELVGGGSVINWPTLSSFIKSLPLQDMLAAAAGNVLVQGWKNGEVV